MAITMALLKEKISKRYGNNKQKIAGKNLEQQLKTAIKNR